jgi:DNA-binding NarL/FixJ family response regulator
MISICIIEDIPEIQQGLESIIANEPSFQLLKSFGNAEEAIEELPKLLPNIVIADINLPGKTGIQCIEEVKQSSPSIQFMMFTIYENNEQVFDALKAGACGYILKNTPPAKIIEFIKESHEGGSPMSAKIARQVISSLQTKTQKETADNELLTSREHEVLEWLSKGFQYKEIADKLGIATSTVKRHLRNVYEKLQVQNKIEAINKIYHH